MQHVAVRFFLTVRIVRAGSGSPNIGTLALVKSLPFPKSRLTVPTTTVPFNPGGPCLVAAAYLTYCVLVLLLKYKAFPARAWSPYVQVRRFRLRHLLFLFAPDFFLAGLTKRMIKGVPDRPRPANLVQWGLRRNIQRNNRQNVFFSLWLLLGMAIAFKTPAAITTFWAWLCVFRMVSRSLEISIAFARDILAERKNDSGLGKFGRIRLALTSYLEIYLFSAAVYLGLGTAKSIFDALRLSAGVGTLANASDIVGGDLVLAAAGYLQIFSTLSLVVLSFAAYVSRTAPSGCRPPADK